MSRMLSASNTYNLFYTLQGIDRRNCDQDFTYGFNGIPSEEKSFQDGLFWSSSRLNGAGGYELPFGTDISNYGKWGHDELPVLGSGGRKKIIGFTKDSSGNPLGSCVIEAFLSSTDQYVGTCVSDTSGYYEMPTEFTGQHYLIAYKAGSPDVAGTTVKTLVPV